MLKKLTQEQLAAVLEAGIAEFAEKGPERASMGAIARAAGLSVGVLYKYYADKEAFFSACLERSLDALVVDARAAAMFAGAPGSGLVAETGQLLGRGLREGPTASRAIGYAQAIAVLDGVIDVAQAVADTAQATRRLASRQIKWFRRDPRIHWIDVALTEDGSLPADERERVVDVALALVRTAPGPAQATP